MKGTLEERKGSKCPIGIHLHQNSKLPDEVDLSCWTILLQFESNRAEQSSLAGQVDAIITT
jgi:hypothetical protein